jgi:DNA-binding response OmpR family regulator
MAKILVVDDESQIRELLRAALTGKGYEVFTAPDAPQAEALLREHPIDLVITDVHMPEAGGLDLVRRIRSSHNRVLILIYSGFISPDLVQSARAAGASDIAAKGEPMTSFLARVERLVQAPAAPAAAGRKILIVDDEKPIRDLLIHFLQSKHFRTAQASSGEEALRVAELERPDAVLLDVRMPGPLDGMATLKRLLAWKPGLTVLMVTGEQDEATVNEAVSHGAAGYLIKPFDFLYLELMLSTKLSTSASP